jgi:hypothetical protein
MFDRIVLMLILANTITLAMLDPTAAEQPPAFAVLEYAFNALFTIEMAIKIVAKGLWGCEAAYLSDNWNRLDFFVVWMVSFFFSVKMSIYESSLLFLLCYILTEMTTQSIYRDGFQTF